MDNKIQKLIIEMLGSIALLTLLEIILLIKLNPTVDISIIVAMVGLVNTIVGGFIGFLTGKAYSDVNTITEIPEIQTNNNTNQEDENTNDDNKVIIGSKSFDETEEMYEYFDKHTINDLINDADNVVIKDDEDNDESKSNDNVDKESAC